MRWILALLTAAAVSGCGADGDPVQPTRNATITLTEAGLSTKTQVGLAKGPLSVSLGLGL
jgi:hypothetical protein